jgi:hypothetical protein
MAVPRLPMLCKGYCCCAEPAAALQWLLLLFNGCYCCAKPAAAVQSLLMPCKGCCCCAKPAAATAAMQLYMTVLYTYVFFDHQLQTIR